MKLISKLLVTTLTACVLLAQPVFAAVTIDTVYVGNPGNANDTTGYGGVPYDYKIGKYEVTLSQYNEFLNAVAKTDTYNLYNPSMGSVAQISGISRSGAAGSYVYTVSGNGSRPVTYVSWYDAARFVNWLQNGQPIGNQVAGVTETGVYALNGATSGTGFTRLSYGLFGLPSENEWYKAAYYDRFLNSGSGGYWLYPTANNAVPNSRNGSLTDPNSGNFIRDDGIANGYNGGYAVNNSPIIPAGSALTAAGAYLLAASSYGTFDQGGNVFEWNDAVISTARGIRGGSWGGNEVGMRATSRNSFTPTGENNIVGFRVVVPEPGVTGLLLLGAALLAGRRRRTA